MFKKGIKLKLISIIVLALIFSSSLSTITNSETTKKIASKSITLNIKQVTIPINGVVSLDYNLKPINSTDEVEWSSNNEDIAIVSKGLVFGLSEGTATITAKTTSGKKDKCKVTVTKQWTENEILKLIKDNSIDEETINKLIEAKIVTLEEIQKLISDKAKDLQPIYNNIYPTTYSTLSQNEFNAMYKNAVNRTITNTINVPCYPSEAFDWITTDIHAVSGSAIKVRITSMNATLTPNDFYSISQSLERNKAYTKYTGTVIVTGYVEQDFPVVTDETIYLSINTITNGVEGRGTGGGALLNPDGTFTFIGKLYENSIIDEIFIRSIEIYGYRYGVYD